VSTPRFATYFAPPELASKETVARQHNAIASNPIVRTMLDSFPEAAAILNSERQIVHANDKLSRLTGQALEALLGQRVGQAFGCEHAEDHPAGCGSAPACAQCGAVGAMMHTVGAGEPATTECRMTLTPQLGRRALDLQVWTTPLPLNGDNFMVFAVRDTSDEERRRVLERMFFHDVLNAAGGLRNLLRLWPNMTHDEAEALRPRLADLAGRVVEEILAQRDLAAAERGELEPSPEQVDVEPMLQELATLYGHEVVGIGKSLEVSIGEGPAVVRADPVLLRRVLANLVKNALEASGDGQLVTLGFSDVDVPAFTVHNETVMPEAVRLQVFQRSFSTKVRSGRGIGTYSARLLTERYLGGTLTFTSEEGKGTTFVVSLPPS